MGNITISIPDIFLEIIDQIKEKEGNRGNRSALIEKATKELIQEQKKLYSKLKKEAKPDEKCQHYYQ